MIFQKLPKNTVQKQTGLNICMFNFKNFGVLTKNNIINFSILIGMENKYPLPQSPEKPNTVNYQESYDSKTEKYDPTTTTETEVPPYQSIQNTPSIQLTFPQFPSGYFIPENLWNWLWKKFHDEVLFSLFKKKGFTFLFLQSNNLKLVLVLGN